MTDPPRITFLDHAWRIKYADIDPLNPNTLRISIEPEETQ